MLFYILFGPSAFLLLIMLIVLRKITKHDNVLFPFCQIRRDIMSLINEEASQINKTDYKVLRTLLDATNMTIHEFNHFKITIFNLRWFIAWLKKYKKDVVSIDKLSTTHAQINKLKDKYRIAMFRAFGSYTPLIKSQIIVIIFLAILQFLFKLGLKSLRFQDLVNCLAWLKNDINTHSNRTPQHA